MSTPVGTLLSGRYRLDAQIGTGGMSTVYRAFDTVLERQVAIKLMHREGTHEADQLERFRREARAVAQLNHPHIVTVIDAGEEGHTDPKDLGPNRPYIVLEYVEGETLKDRIRRHGRLPVAEAVAYAIEVARALGAAHERGIVHRDVKPQNVLIDEEGSAKVTDFGIARTLDQDGLTADGRVLGTTDYVSPEQALGHPVTGQSDLYSLGVVLFEMLTGDVPFKGENQVAVAMKHVREELPDVQIRRPEVSSALGAVVDRATAKDLGRRYPDDASLISDLEDVLTVEAARSGQAGGQATAVIRTLPSAKRRRIPDRVLHPRRIFAVMGVSALLVVAGLVLARDHAQRGTGTSNARRAGPPPAGTVAVSLSQGAAHDYDPEGTDKSEHPEAVKSAVDGDPGTFWFTETYHGGTFPPPKQGVGIYVDARPSAAATRMEITSPTPGWGGTVYGAPAGSGPPKQLDAGWTSIGDVASAGRTTRVDLAGTRYRYFLVWIQRLPPEGGFVRISEIALYQRKPA